MADSSIPQTRPIVTRAEAKAAGLKRYFLGTPCRKGHIAERFTSDAHCVICNDQKCKEWYKNNVRHVSKKCAEWRKKNPEKFAEMRARELEPNRKRVKLWAKNNPKKVAENSSKCSKRRAERLKAAGGFHTADDLTKILVDQNGKCNGCHCDIWEIYERDHIIPISRGGPDWPDNIQLLCPKCNRRKATKTMKEWTIWREKYEQIIR